MANINKHFYPQKEIFDSLPIREQEQLSLLTGSNLVFMILFAVFGIVLFIFNYIIVGLGGLFLLAFFGLSLFFIKQGHIHRGAWTTSIAIMLVSAVECYGAPFSVSNFLPYRDCCFIAVMSVCNYVISLRRKKI